MTQKPSLGRVVLIKLTELEQSTNNNATFAPAVIVRVWSDELVNLKVQTDGPEDLWRTSVKLVETPEDLDDAEDGTCFFPPRV